MTKAERNIVTRLVEAMIKVERYNINMNNAETDEEAEKWQRSYRAARKERNFIRELFEGYITADDLLADFTLNEELVKICEANHYPYPFEIEGDAVREFFGDMIVDSARQDQI